MGIAWPWTSAQLLVLAPACNSHQEVVVQVGGPCPHWGGPGLGSHLLAVAWPRPAAAAVGWSTVDRVSVSLKEEERGVENPQSTSKLPRILFAQHQEGRL